MRAFCARRVALATQASLAVVCSPKQWCSTNAKADEDNAKTTEKGAGTGESVSKTAMAELEKDLEESKKVLEDLKKDLHYRTGDVENARRIGREDVEKAKQFGITSFGKDMLEVADTLEKGVEAFGKIQQSDLDADKSLNSIFTGMKLALKVLHENMSKHGIEKMGVKIGTPFDYNSHEAIVRLPATPNAPADTVAHVLKDGYTIKTRILRAAQVAVSSDEGN